ncbi:hypothetical protein SISNIDRAFT_448824 [Sistotremastrum niveocremeum HHB9708]|uniref:Uncharacterized protein n=2 Tax=Sistotremastraceae TaxID=3402574 RepID=A0A165A6W6_9AGAM|nr:hypothetical protein SISNIDRAFT_448824 [Sistotremastrum niveocremeum HHB9708]KZT43512.1 hypothetical protein SISSUDRAFT_1124653 [Sistotremastrum suecicum HHB10207 ss-3]
MSDQLPLRTDSLAATRSEALSTTISESEEIISDARRILEVGSPEDAQVALAHIIALAEELVGFCTL